MKLNHLSSNTRVDTHCHLFNKKVLSWRLLIDFIQSRLNIPIPSNGNELDASLMRISNIKRVYNFIEIGLHSSSEGVYKILAKTEKDYAVVPLMFDLDYCMKGSQDSQEIENIQNEILASYIQALEDDRKELLGMRIEQDTNNLVKINDKQNEIDELLQTVETLLGFNYQSNEFDLAAKEDPFLNQENQLVDLQKKYPDKVFPFYAVDPRRKENYILENGTYDLSPILKRLNINGGHFYGIKLYTPNGYSPADPMLMALYQYCEQHSIPITAHCSEGGFASFAKTINIQGLIYQDVRIQEHNGNITFKHYKVTDKERVHEKAQMLNHPLIWEKVLEKYPNLSLNLAHFGSSKESEEWSQHILRLMKLYPNLYTDFSCISEASTLNAIYNTYYSKADQSIKSRFLYGSDFYLNMLFIDKFEQYVNQFEKTFTANEMKEIAEINPRRFLKI